MVSFARNILRLLVLCTLFLCVQNFTACSSSTSSPTTNTGDDDTTADDTTGDDDVGDDDTAGDDDDASDDDDETGDDDATLTVNAVPIRAGGFITRLAQDPQNPDSLWAGSDVGGLFFSDDAGLSWQPKNSSRWRDDHYAIDDILVDAVNADRLYVLGGYYSDSDGHADVHGVGLLYSDDGGETFAQKNGYALSTASTTSASYLSTANVVLKNDGRRTERLYVSGTQGQRQIADGKRLAIDPSSCVGESECQIIYMADFSQGVFKSSDGGSRFYQLPLPPLQTSLANTLRVSSINLLPVTVGDSVSYLLLVGTRLFHEDLITDAFTTGALYLGFNGGDEPEDWITISTDYDVRDIAVAPTLDLASLDANDVLFLAAGKDGVVKAQITALDSITPAATFTFTSYDSSGGAFGVGLDYDTSSATNIYANRTGTFVSVEIDPTDAAHLFATSIGQGEIYESTDAGVNWTQRYDVSDISNLDYNTWWADGMYWKFADFAASLVFDSAGANIWFSDWWNVWQGDADTATFVAQGVGIEDTQVHAIAVSPDGQNVLLATADHTLFRSTDAGSSVLYAGNGANPSGTTAGISSSHGLGNDVAIFPTRNASDLYTVALATISSSTSVETAGAVYVSEDSGETFTNVGGGLPYGKIKAVAFLPSDATVLYVALDSDVVTYGDTSDAGLFRLTNDDTSTWTVERITAFDAHVDLGSTFTHETDLVLTPTGDKLYVINRDSGVFVYTPADDTINELTLPSVLPLALAIDPSNTQKLFLGTYGDGLWVSADAGSTWEQTVADQNIYSIAISPVNSDVIWLGGMTHYYDDSDDEYFTQSDTDYLASGLWLSVDGGASFASRNSVVEGIGITIESLFADPLQAGRVWVATFGQGAYFVDEPI